MNTENPNTIILFDGTQIVGYPKSEVSEPIDNSMKIDTTGQYLAVGSKPKPFPKTPEEVKALQEFFFQNAFLFLYHREAILSDSRLFLTPLPFQSGLAYIGEGGFRHPTLGVYIEWWLNCPTSIIQCANQKIGLLYSLAGSPLTGSNSCGVVGVEGDTWREYVRDFNSACGLMMRINKMYDTAKQQYQAYTLEEAIEVVKALPPKPISFEYDLQLILMHNEIVYLKKLHDRDVRYAYDQDHKITQLIIEANYETYKSIYLEYAVAHKKAEEEIADAYEQRIELRKRLKEGEISNKEHQHLLQPYSKIIREKLLDVESEFSHRLHEISPDINLRRLNEYFTLHPIQND